MADPEAIPDTEFMKRFLLSLAVLGMFSLAAARAADDAAQCTAAAGTYRSGVIVKGPKFAHGQYRKGVELSHTHLKMKADQDGQIYDIAIDNVFAQGFDPRQQSVPASLERIRVNDRVAVCGQLYTRGGVGIHWVHTNCGKRPTPNKPDGWIKLVGRDGRTGSNIEDNSAYCDLFKH